MGTTEIVWLSIAGTGFLMLLVGMYGQRMPLKYRSIKSDRIFSFIATSGAVLMILGLVVYKFML